MKKILAAKTSVVMVALFSFLLASCSGVRILSTDANPEFSLSSYKSFDFVPMTIDPNVEPEFVQRVDWVEEGLIDYFTGRGLVRSENNPDMLINIGIVYEEKIQTRETTFRDAPIYIGQRNYSWQSTEVEVGRYNEGTVTIDLIDRQDYALMWKGVAQSVVAKTEKNSRKNIAAGIQMLFANLP